jgi:6-phosphogluconolactonase
MRSTRTWVGRLTGAGLAICLWMLVGLTAAGVAQERESDEGRIYLMANAATGNTIVVLRRGEDGQMSRLQEVATSGLGSGPGELPPPFPPGLPGPNALDSQDALVMTDNGRFLVAVNAGSNDISVLAVTQDGLRLVDKASSGGIFPVAVAQHHNLIYVVNNGGRNGQTLVGGTPTVRGFRLDHTGKLHEIAHSTMVIGPNMSHPADAIFTPDGDRLIITEQSSNMIQVFPVDDDGRLGNPVSIRANTDTPFGMAFGHHNVLAVTEVNGLPVGVQNGATMSTYRLNEDNGLEPVSRSVSTHQSAACWVRFTPNGHYAYTSNPGSGSLSSFLVSRSGELTLQAAVAADAGGHFSGPLDLDITPDGKYLYVLGSFIGTIQGYRIENDGSLTHVASLPGFPFTIQGIVVR